jgi:hypothetical protein
MKVFLTNNDIGPIGYEVFSVYNLDDICDGECYEIYMDEFLINSFSINRLEDHLYDNLKLILNKVAIDGVIIIHGLDIELFARDIIWGNLDYETKQSIMDNVQNAITWKLIRDILLGCGFTINRIELDGPEFVLEGKR